MFRTLTIATVSAAVLLLSPPLSRNKQAAPPMKPKRC